MSFTLAKCGLSSKPHAVAAAAPTLQECTNLLAASAVYHPDLDSPTQRAALLDFYDSTGGRNWANQPVNELDHGQILQVVDGVIEAGYELTDGSLDVSTLPAELVSDAANIPSLSADCALQQYLSLGQLWLTYSWGSNVSYCYWTGITCCQNVSSGHCLLNAAVVITFRQKTSSNTEA